MIDLHTHVLPGIDDGAPDVGTSLEMARRWEAEGIDTIVATPHVSFRYANTATGIAAATDELNAALEEAGVAPRVVAGAEVNVLMLAELADEELPTLGVGGGPWLLTEFPLGPSPVAVEPVQALLRERGLRPLIAHAERCHVFQRDQAAVGELIRAGAAISITAGSLTGDFGREVKRYATTLLADGLVHNISSDAHGLRGRDPAMLAALAQAGCDPGYYLGDAPAALLAGETPPVPPRPRPGRRRGLFGQWRAPTAAPKA